MSDTDCGLAFLFRLNMMEKMNLRRCNPPRRQNPVAAPLTIALQYLAHALSWSKSFNETRCKAFIVDKADFFDSGAFFAGLLSASLSVSIAEHQRSASSKANIEHRERAFTRH